MRAGQPATKAECRACGEFVIVTNAGVLARHPRTAPRWCPGTGQPGQPHYTHVCQCGVRWDEQGGEADGVER